MIEKFTPEEIEIIKKELGVSDKTLGSKKFLLSEEHSRCIKLAGKRRRKETTAKNDIWNAILCLCDHTIMNYKQKTNYDNVFKYERYSSIFGDKLERYKTLADKIFDLIEEEDNYIESIERYKTK